MENLILAGGGIKVLSYFGALRYVNKIHNIKNIKRIIATSAGSIVGLMVLLDFSLDEMLNFVIEHNFNDLKETENILSGLSRFAVNFGFYSTEILENWIYKLFDFKNISYDITFLQFYNLIKKDLILTCTCLNTHSLRLLSFEHTPDIQIINAIKIAMSLPFAFEPVIIDNYYYVDGALICNYPFEFIYKFDPDLKKTIGMNLISDDDNNNSIYGFVNYIDAILRSITSHQYKDYPNTIVINTKEISTLDFQIDNIKKDKLFSRGYRSAKNYFKKII